jgi:hypothetical protein
MHIYPQNKKYMYTVRKQATNNDIHLKASECKFFVIAAAAAAAATRERVKKRKRERND